MEGESWRRNHERGIIEDESWRRIMQEESWRVEHVKGIIGGGIMKEEASGGIRAGTSGPGSILEAL